MDTQRIDNLTNQLANLVDSRTFDALLPNLLKMVNDEELLDFLFSVQYKRKPLLTEGEKQIIASIENLLRVSLYHLGNIWNISTTECDSLRRLARTVKNDEPYSRRQVMETLLKSSDLLQSVQQILIEIPDVKTAAHALLVCYHCLLVLEAHELLDLRDTHIRDAILKMIVLGIETLKREEKLASLARKGAD